MNRIFNLWMMFFLVSLGWVSICCSASSDPKGPSSDSKTAGTDSKTSSTQDSAGLSTQDSKTSSVQDSKTSNSQTAKVVGNVHCSCSSTTPVPNVKVEIGQQSTTADSAGHYEISDVPLGKQPVKASGSPYHEDFSGEIDVKTGTNQYDIVMQLK